MTVQELIDKLNSFPYKNKEIFCKGIWDDISYEIRDIDLGSEGNRPIIIVE